MADVSLLFLLTRLARISNIVVHKKIESQRNIESVQNAVACGEENKEIRPPRPCFKNPSFQRSSEVRCHGRPESI